MLILPDFNKPHLIDSLTDPIVVKYNWVFNAQLCDFMLQKITYLEETSGGAVKIRVNNSEFWVPSTWNILVTDDETYQIDTVPIQSCANINHIAYGFSPNYMNLQTFNILVLDYAEHKSLVHPMINKGTAMVHPVGPVEFNLNTKIDASIVIGPFDLSKYLTNKVVGDLIS